MNTHRTTSRLLPYIALTAAVLFWGASFPAGRVAVGLLHPQAVMFCRMVIACIILAPFIKNAGIMTFDRRDLKLLVPTVLLQPCLYFLLESHALKLTTSSQAGVISAAVPLLVGCGAWLFFGERINKKMVTGLALSVAGVTAMTLYGANDLKADNPFLGNCLEFLAMACAAGNMLLIKVLSKKYSTWTLTCMQFLTGLVFFSPGARYIAADPAVLCNPDLIKALGLLGVFASVGAFGLYNWAMGKLPASRASAFINLVPAVAVFLGWTLLDESLARGQVAGALMVGLGVLISQQRSRKDLQPGAPATQHEKVII